MQPHDKWRRRAHGAFALFIAATFAAVAWTWRVSEAQRQDKWTRTAALGFAAYAGFLLWVMLASGWRTGRRWIVFIGTIAVVAFCAATLRIGGVTGDLLPILEWRWASHSRSIDTPFPNAPVLGSKPSGMDAAGNSTNSYPQFLGPNRNGVMSGPRLAHDWQRSPPRELWRRSVGAAWSGFAVAGGRAITQEQRSGKELVVCYDALTGKPIWSHADESRYATTIAGEGPRATPAIDGDFVYTMGGRGILNSLELTTGKLRWQTNTVASHDAKVPEWGVACSPLVTERAVIVTVGGRNSTLVAYDKLTGAELWSSGNDDVHWSSPVRALFDGVPQIIVFCENVSGHDERTGKVLWEYPWPHKFPHVTAPLVLSSNRVLVSQGYGAGSELVQISHEGSRWRATRIWKSIRLKSKFANLSHLDGFVYGLDDGALACLDAGTGDLKWKGDRFGHGQMILVDDLLLLTAENGEIVLVEPNPNEQRELARFKVFGSKTWNPPALAGDLLFVRNDREAACLRLPVLSVGKDK